jgi:hypothetical protein
MMIFLKSKKPQQFALPFEKSIEVSNTTTWCLLKNKLVFDPNFKFAFRFKTKVEKGTLCSIILNNNLLIVAIYDGKITFFKAVFQENRVEEIIIPVPTIQTKIVNDDMFHVITLSNFLDISTVSCDLDDEPSLTLRPNDIANFNNFILLLGNLRYKLIYSNLFSGRMADISYSTSSRTKQLSWTEDFEKWF